MGYVAPAHACSLCETDCSKLAYSPLHGPYGQRDAAEKAHVLHKGVWGQQLHALSAKSAREPFYKLHERPGYPTRGMLALNTIIQGSKHFKTPPPTKNVYKTVTKKAIYRDP